jgi:hypothetical protein
VATLDPLADARTLAEAELLRARAATRALARRGLYQGVAVLVGLVGLVMLVVAGFLALSDAYGAVNGALLTGGILLAAAVLLALAARPLSRSRSLDHAERAASQARADLRGDADALQTLLRLLSGDASTWTAEHRLSVLVAAFGAGLGFGLRSRARRRGEGPPDAS